jgi:hypothetical protein
MWLRMIPTGLGMTSRTTFGDQTDTAHRGTPPTCSSPPSATISASSNFLGGRDHNI